GDQARPRHQGHEPGHPRPRWPDGPAGLPPRHHRADLAAAALRSVQLTVHLRLCPSTPSGDTTGLGEWTPMTTDDPAGRHPKTEPEREPDPQTGTDEPPASDGPTDHRQPRWWHRDHPTFSALAGFFTGLLFVALVPATYVGALSLMFDNQKVEDLFPFVLVTLV